MKFPVLVTFIVCAARVVPTTWGPNISRLGVTTRVFASATPVPFKLTIIETPAVWAMVSVAGLEPATVGVKVTVMPHVFPVGGGDSIEQPFEIE